MDDDEIAFSVRLGDQPDAFDRFQLGAKFVQRGVTYRVVTCAFNEATDDVVLTVTGRTWPPSAAGEKVRRERRRADEHRQANPGHVGDMGAVPYLATARAKVLRAQAHADGLRETLDAYLSRRPWTSQTATDGSDRRYWQVLRLNEPPPDLRASITISEVANLLRGAMDNWLFHTVTGRVHTNKHDSNIEFPIRKFESQFDQWAADPRRRWLDDGLRVRLREVQPFTGGSMALHWLHRLSNHDKHRLPVPVGLFASSGSFGIVDCPEHVARTANIDMRFPEGFVEDGTRHGETTLRAPCEDLRLAHELHLGFGLEVRDEPRPLPVLAVLSQMTFAVDAALRNFESGLRDDRSGGRGR